MKHRFKSILSVLLSLVLVLACIPLMSLEANAFAWSDFRIKTSVNGAWSWAPSDVDPFHSYPSTGYFWMDYTGNEHVEFRMTEWHKNFGINSNCILIITSSGGGTVKLWASGENLFRLEGGTLVIGPNVWLESNQRCSAVAGESGTSYFYNIGGRCYAQSGAASIWTDSTLHVYNGGAVDNVITSCTTNTTCYSLSIAAGSNITSVQRNTTSLLDSMGVTAMLGAWYTSGSTANISCTVPTGYGFTHWVGTGTYTTPSVNVTMNQTQNLTASAEILNYTITFVSEGEVMQSSILNYGTTPTYTGLTPTKASTAEYDYTFSHWYPTPAVVTSAATYTAQFSSQRRSYNVSFVNDGKVLQSGAVEYGTLPAYSGPTPTKDATAEYTYTFSGWDKTFTPVTGDVTYEAQFSAARNNYTATLSGDDGVTLTNSGTTTLPYGETFTFTVTPKFGYEHTPPTVYANGSLLTGSYAGGTYTYSVTLTENVDITVTSSVNKYSLTVNTGAGYTANAYLFENIAHGGSVTVTITLNEGYTDTPPVVSATMADIELTSQNGNSYTYTVSDITGYSVVSVNASINIYKVTFVNEDGSLLQEVDVNHGELPDYTADVPQKASTAQYGYTFSGWDTDLSPALGAKTYTAVFTSYINKYEVTFKNADGSILQTISEIEYGQTPVYTGETPQKDPDVQSVYTFDGWDPEIAAVTGDSVYTAVYIASARPYEIKFNNDNGDLLYSAIVPYGELPVYNGETPLKAADAQYTYVFKDWSPEITAVTGNNVYTAQYTETLNKYTVSFFDEDTTILLYEADFDYGTLPVYDTETLGLPSKAADVQYNYTFNGWSPELTEVTADAQYFATYLAALNKYTISFVNDNGDLLKSYLVDYGTTPVYDGETPVKAADAQFIYYFNTWDTTPAAVTGDAVYTATYTTTPNSHKIDFVNFDGALLFSQVLEYGELPVYGGETPVRPADAQYTYTFNDWLTPVTTVTGPAEYVAGYTTELNYYDIIFKGEDGNILDEQTLAYGRLPVYAGETPVKDATAQFSYTHSGWSPALTEVTGNAEYTAVFSSEVNKYEISFVNFDGAVLQSTYVSYGETPAYSGETPLRSADAQYTYTFDDWDEEISAVTGAKTYTAVYTAETNSYLISFANFDGAVLQSTYVLYGDLPAYSGETPLRAADVQYTYIFDDWDEEISTVTGAKTYTAQYINQLREYMVTFNNYDGTLLQSSAVPYGTLPVYIGATPEKPSDVQYTYRFDNAWDKEIVAVTGEAVYTAVFTGIVNKYEIIFKGENDAVLQSELLEYGTLPQYTSDTPVKASTVDTTFTFDKWDTDITEVTGAKTYTATFVSAVRKYTITFENYDGSLLGSYSVEYGSTPAYDGAVPERAATAQYTYTFDTWQPAVTSVTGDATYTATYTATVNKYTVSFYNDDNTTLLYSQQLEYGAVPEYKGDVPLKAATAQYTYAFNDWDKPLAEITGDTSFTAVYTATVNSYIIVFQNYDLTTLKEYSVEYGSVPVYDGTTPEKPGDVQYSWIFDGWDTEPCAVTGEKTYTAVFTGKLNSYAVSFVNYDNTALFSMVYEYGATPVYDGKIPAKPETAQFYFAFSGFGEIKPVTGPAVYTAQFSETLRAYTVKFVDDNGKVLQSGRVNYGATPAYTAETPADRVSSSGHQAFNGWDKSLAPVTGAATYTATYVATPHILTETVTQASCTENGSKTFTCSLCDYVSTPTVIPAAGHSYNSLTDDFGNIIRTCTVCADTVVIPVEETTDEPIIEPGDSQNEECPDCGRVHGDGFFAKILCMLITFINRITNLFGSIGG